MTDRPTDGQTVSHFQEVYVFIYVDFLLTSKSCFEGNSSARSNTNPPKNNNNNNVIRLLIDKNPNLRLFASLVFASNSKISENVKTYSFN